MLWIAFDHALETLLYWEVYAAGLVYLLFAFGPMVLLGSLSGGARTGLAIFIQPFSQALGILVFVTLVVPIATGTGNASPWNLPWQFLTEAPWDVLKMSFQLVVISVVIAFLPILSSLASFNTLILGVFATKMVLELAGVRGVSLADLTPSLSIGLGILALGAAVSVIGLLLIAAIFSILAIVLRQNYEDFSTLIAFPVLGVLGFAPLLVYYAWLGLSLS